MHVRSIQPPSPRDGFTAAFHPLLGTAGTCPFRKGALRGKRLAVRAPFSSPRFFFPTAYLSPLSHTTQRHSACPLSHCPSLLPARPRDTPPMSGGYRMNAGPGQSARVAGNPCDKVVVCSLSLLLVADAAGCLLVWVEPLTQTFPT